MRFDEPRGSRLVVRFVASTRIKLQKLHGVRVRIDLHISINPMFLGHACHSIQASVYDARRNAPHQNGYAVRYHFQRAVSSQ